VLWDLGAGGGLSIGLEALSVARTWGSGRWAARRVPAALITPMPTTGRAYRQGCLEGEALELVGAGADDTPLPCPTRPGVFDRGMAVGSGPRCCRPCWSASGPLRVGGATWATVEPWRTCPPCWSGRSARCQ